MGQGWRSNVFKMCWKGFNSMLRITSCLCMHCTIMQPLHQMVYKNSSTSHFVCLLLIFKAVGCLKIVAVCCWNTHFGTWHLLHELCPDDCYIRGQVTNVWNKSRHPPTHTRPLTPHAATASTVCQIDHISDLIAPVDQSPLPHKQAKEKQIPCRHSN